MRITLTLGLALVCLSLVLTLNTVQAVAPDRPSTTLPSSTLSGRSTLSDTIAFTNYLPVVAVPNLCRLSPCLVSIESFDDVASGWLTHTWNPGEPTPHGPHEMIYWSGAYQLYYSPSLPYRMMASVSPITHQQNSIIDVQAHWTEFQWSNGYGIVFGADAPYSPTHFYAAVVSCLGSQDCNWNHVILWRIDDFEQFSSHQPSPPGQPPNSHARVELSSNTLCTPCKAGFAKWNQIRLIRDGPGIELHVNGTLVLTATDDTYPGAGYVGLLVENWENNRPTNVEVDNLYVYDLGP